MKGKETIVGHGFQAPKVMGLGESIRHFEDYLRILGFRCSKMEISRDYRCNKMLQNAMSCRIC